jgi:hypothetical protein
MIKRTISGMIGKGSLAHNRREFFAENVEPDRVQLNICYQNENLKEVYKELFDDAVERYNLGKRKDWQIINYYDKIRQGKQEKLFHEAIFQIGNRENMAVKVLDEYVKDFQKRNPTLRKQFLKEHRSARYQYLLLTGKLNEHLNQTDQEAREQVEMLMKQMAEKKGVTEELKVQDQMKWVGLMNNIKVSAEEIILKNMVYV